MAMVEWIPNYIRKNIQYRPHEVLTAKEFNALINLLITQGDYNSSWLEYLSTAGIPSAIADLNSDQIEKVLTEVVEAEVNALAASVVNKSSARLEQPVFAFLNLSMQADMAQFRTVVEQYEVPGSFCIATNLVGASAAYPTLITLQAMRAAGHDILPLGVDGSPYETASAEDIMVALERTKEYMNKNFVDTGVFVYPEGTTTNTVVDTVRQYYPFAINTAVAQSNIESDALYVEDTCVQLPVLRISATNTLNNADVKRIIDDAITTNKCCIIAADTSATDYSEEALTQVLEYIKSNAGVAFTTVSEAVSLCDNTINNLIRKLFTGLTAEVVDRQNAINVLTAELEQATNRIEHTVLQDCYITQVPVTNAQGEVHNEKYLNW